MHASALLFGINEILDGFIDSVFRHTLLYTILCIAAALVFTAGAGLFVYARLRSKPAYLCVRTSRPAGQYLFAALVAALAVLRFADGSGALHRVLAAASALIGAAGIFGVLTRRQSGAVLSLVSVWLSLPAGELPAVLGAIRDRSNIGAYAPASRVAVLAAGSYILSRTVVLALIASAITVVMIAYFTKRRYLFRSAQLHYFSGIAVCPDCGAPACSEGRFCPVCGTDLEGLPRSGLKWEPLDEAKFCTECGARLDDGGHCRACEKGAPLSGTLKSSIGDALKDTLKSKLIYLVVPVLLLLPIFLGNGPGFIPKGSAAVHNAYVARFNEWYDDPAIAENETWLASYEEAADALYRVNGRVLDLNPDRLGYTDLYVYLQYSEASFSQMAVLERIDRAVHEADPSEKDTLSALFNETADLQQRALAGGLGLISSARNKLKNLVVDSCRFYLSWIPHAVTVIVLFVLGAAALIAGAVLCARRKGGSPFTVAALSANVTAEQKRAAEQRHRTYRRRERTAMLIGTAIALLAIGVGFGVSYAKNVRTGPTAEDALHTALIEDGASVIAWLSECQTDPQNALAHRSGVIRTIDGCTAGLDRIQTDPEIGPAFSDVIDPLLNELSELKKTAGSDALPDSDTCKRITDLFLQAAERYEQRLVQQTLDALNDL